MVYRAIGIMSGSSLDGLDIAFVELTETGGNWGYAILSADCIEYSHGWKDKLTGAIALTALDYQLLHTAYGQYIGEQVNLFIEKHQLQHQVHLLASHGHTSFHLPGKRMTAQLGDGAAIAAVTKLPVVSDLRALDVALGGQGAPIVPIGEKLLFGEVDFLLNIGGIANISVNDKGKYTAFDVCAANRVLNMLAQESGKAYDEGGIMAASGKLDDTLLMSLNNLEYYKRSVPKSLANSFGTDVVFPLIKNARLSNEDALRTYTEHVAVQIAAVLKNHRPQGLNQKLLITGGGAFNTFLIERLGVLLAEQSIEIAVPEEKLVQYKEALIMALIGVLRWREEVNVLSSVTGASQNSIGGALWLGTDVA
jgi:anhydro-N-acetylmuramic acid kinase